MSNRIKISLCSGRSTLAMRAVRVGAVAQGKTAKTYCESSLLRNRIKVWRDVVPLDMLEIKLQKNGDWVVSGLADVTSAKYQIVLGDIVSDARAAVIITKLYRE